MDEEYTMDKEYMADIVEGEYIRADSCPSNRCYDCPDLEECYYRISDELNSGFAESINYGGYASEEEFWDNL